MPILDTLKYVSVGILLVFVGYLGYKVGLPDRYEAKRNEIKYQELLTKYESLKSEHEKTVKVMSGETVTVTTKTTKPDGTITETTTKTEKNDKTITTVKDKTSTVKKETANVTKNKTKTTADVVRPIASSSKVQYRLGTVYRVDSNYQREVYVSTGYRLGSSPLWLDGHWQTKLNAVLLGISLEF